MRPQGRNQYGSRGLKIDFNDLLPAPLLDKTRKTERMIIGSILTHHGPNDDQLQYAMNSGIGPEDFSTQQMAMLFQGMLDTKGEDGTDFLSELSCASHYQFNVDDLTSFMDEGVTIRDHSLTWHCRTIKMLSFERMELNLVAEIGGLLQKGEDASETYGELNKLREEKTEYLRGEPEAFDNGLNEWWTQFDFQREDGFIDELEIKSHLPSLDEQTQGFRKSEVSVLAGSPGSGKSALAMNFLLSAMNASRIKCALISLEMPLSEILSRMIVQMSEDVPLRDLLNPTRLQPRHWKNNPDRLKKIMEQIGKARMRTDQIQQEGIFQAKALANFSPDVVLGSLERAAKSGAQFLVMDHLHRINFPEGRAPYTDQMTKFMVSLTEIAKSYNCHILAVSQLNRDSSREGRKPRLTDLRGSGGIEENTSLALFLSRDLDSSEGNLSVLKARSGRSGWWISLVFNPRRMTYGEIYE